MLKIIDLKVEQSVKKVRNEVGSLGEEVQKLSEQVKATDTKLEVSIEAKLVDNITKSAELIRKELEPSWAGIVAKEVDCKFERVAGDVTKVQQTLSDVKIKRMKRKTERPGLLTSLYIECLKLKQLRKEARLIGPFVFNLLRKPSKWIFRIQILNLHSELANLMHQTIRQLDGQDHC